MSILRKGIPVVIPAKAAGVVEVILATPPGPDGNVPAPALAAACGEALIIIAARHLKEG